MGTGGARVCLLTETFAPVLGGGENQARLLAGRLVGRGVSVFVLTRRIRPDLPWEDQIDAIPVRRVGPSGFVRYGKYLMLPGAFLALVQERSRYDVLYVCGYRVLGVVAIAAGKLLGKRVVLKAESEGEFSGAFMFDDRRVTNNRLLGCLARGLLAGRNAVLRRADAFVSISSRITRELQDAGIRRDAIHPIPNGIDPQVFQSVTAPQKSSLRERLGLPVDRRIIAYSGKLNRYKGLELLLKVWKGVVAKHREAYLLLVGSGQGQYLSCEEELRHFVDAEALSGDVGFTGFVEPVSPYLQASDAYVFPSEREGLPVALIEAMACSLPVVATRVGAIPEFIDGCSNGLLVEPKAEGPLRAAIYRLLEERPLASLLGLNGRRTAEQFDVERIAAQYAELFGSLNGRHGAGERA